MKKLFLTSSGINPNLTKSFLDFYGKDPGGNKVAFVTTAANPKKIQMYIDQAKQELIDLGFDVEEVDFEILRHEKLKKSLEKADLIYVNSGNTFYLLKYARESGFDKMLPGLLSKGIVYVGVSAGSILVGPNIEVSGWGLSWDKNMVKLTDTSGLNLVPIAISPHFDDNEEKVISENEKKVNYSVVRLKDSEAVQVTNNGWKVVR